MSQPIYNLKTDKLQNFLPQVYPRPIFLVDFIYSVPIDNCIATINYPTFFQSYNVTILKFKKNEIVKDEVIKGDYVEGVFPAFNDRYIPLNGNRSIYLCDLKKEKINRMELCTDFDEWLNKFDVIDGNNLIGIVEMTDARKDSKKLFLRKYDFSKDKPILLAEKEIAYGNGMVGRDYWQVVGQTVFISNNNGIKAYDQNLKEINHPLVDLFEHQFKANCGEILELSINPKNNFAIIVEYSKKEQQNVWLLKWDSDLTQQSVTLLFNNQFINKFTFSPDGKWAVFNIYNTYYTMAVDIALPHLLGKPIILGEMETQSGDHVWTRNPMTYVRKGYTQVFRWEFDKIDKKLRGGE